MGDRGGFCTTPQQTEGHCNSTSTLFPAAWTCLPAWSTTDLMAYPFTQWSQDEQREQLHCADAWPLLSLWYNPVAKRLLIASRYAASGTDVFDINLNVPVLSCLGDAVVVQRNAATPPGRQKPAGGTPAGLVAVFSIRARAPYLAPQRHSTTTWSAESLSTAPPSASDQFAALISRPCSRYCPTSAPTSP